MFQAQEMPPAAAARFPTQLTLFGHALSTWAEVGIVAVFAITFFWLAVRGLSHAT